MKSWLTLIGDVHGDMLSYIKTAKQSEYSIQLGDLGFDYSALKSLDTNHHKFLGGNHDNYSVEFHGKQPDEVRGDPMYVVHGSDVSRFTKLPPHYLGDFGTWTVPDVQPGELSGDIFFVRGAWSIDQKMRIPGRSWWPDEEMSYGRLSEALDAYIKAKPDFVISHDAPQCVYPYLMNGRRIISSRTSVAMEQMFSAHKPKLWVFAHHHLSFQMRILDTMFICVDILASLDFARNLEIIVDEFEEEERA